MKYFSSKIAFTLIELLVVIAIISLLVSILLPSLGKAKDKAAQVMCLTQLKQVGTAMYIYAQEERVFQPCFVPAGKEGTTYNNSYWEQKLLPYVGDSPKALVCTGYSKSPNASQDSTYNYYYWFCGGSAAPRYGFNHLALGCGGYSKYGYDCVATDGSKKVEVGPENLVNPSSLGMCYDNGVAFGSPPSAYGSNYEWARNNVDTFFPDSVMHNGGLNLLFSDAHAEWMSFDNEEYWFEDNKHWVNK